MIVQYLGTIELIFEFNREPGHEILLMYEADFADPHFYQVDSIEGSDEGEKFVALWIPIEAFRSHQALLGPEELLGLLDRPGISHRIDWGRPSAARARPEGH